MTSSIFSSKTFWAGALTVIVAALTALQQVNPAWGSWITVILGILTLIGHSNVVAGQAK